MDSKEKYYRIINNISINQNFIIIYFYNNSEYY